MQQGKAADGMRAPRQARSQDSTSRVLDAALAILDRDGMTGLSTAAVSRESGVSNGSIYHRFGDRHSLLVAAQERFLERFQAEWLTAGTPVWDIADQHMLLARLVEIFLQSFTRHRGLLRVFMISGHDDADLRARGADRNRRAAQFFIDQFTERFACTPEAADTAFRLLFAQAALTVVFGGEEITALPVAPAVRRDHLARALHAVLAR
jgi:AcrR family transcriptional regulator